MKRAVIVHCWGGKPEYAWYPWVKSQLEDRDFAVYIPAMPNTDQPQLSEWLPALRDAIGEPDDQLILITHSLGTITVLHYLSQLEQSNKIGGLVVVAGNLTDVGYPDDIGNFFTTMPDLHTAAQHIAAPPELFYSDDDPYVPVSHGYTLHEAIGGNLTIVHSKQHFSGPLGQATSCTELPQVVMAVDKIADAM